MSKRGRFKAGLQYSLGLLDAKLDEKESMYGASEYKMDFIGSRTAFMYPPLNRGVSPISWPDDRFERPINKWSASPLLSTPVFGRYSSCPGLAGTYGFMRDIFEVGELWPN